MVPCKSTVINSSIALSCSHYRQTIITIAVTIILLYKKFTQCHAKQIGLRFNFGTNKRTDYKLINREHDLQTKVS